MSKPTANATIAPPPRRLPALRWLRRHGFVALALAAIMWTLMAHAVTFPYTADDAFISYRYVQNFLLGHGLTWNPGEVRVEGYSNPLYVFILCAGGKLGFDINGFSVWLNLACALIALPLCLGLAIRMAGGKAPRALALFAPLLTALNENYAVWIHGGLETVPYGTLLLLLAWFGQGWPRAGARRFAGLSALFALATLMRMDAALIFVGWWMLTALLLCVGPGRARPREIVRRLLAAGLPFTLIVGAHLLWRHAYYGEWLPNTYYAKMTGGAGNAARGWRYLGDYVVAFEWTGLPVLLLAAIVALRRRAPMAIYLMLASLAVIVYVGGDVLMAWRFIVPLMPLGYALLAAGTARLAVQCAGPRLSARMNGAAIAGALLVFCAAHVVQARWPETCGANMLRWPGKIARGDWPCVGDNDFDPVRRVGLALKAALPPKAVVACVGVGRIAYYSEHPVLDLLGLNDKHIARIAVAPGADDGPGHQKYDADYVVARRPEVYLAGYKMALDKPVPPTFKDAAEWSDAGLLPIDWLLLRRPEILKDYAPQVLPLGGGLYCPLMRRRDLPTLAQAP